VGRAREDRAERIRKQLRTAEEAGAIRSWYVYSPGDRRGTRWIVEIGGSFAERSFSTTEAEAFALGATVGLEATSAAIAR